MRNRIAYPYNLEIKLLLEDLWNLAIGDRLTWQELEQGTVTIQGMLDRYKQENNLEEV